MEWVKEVNAQRGTFAECGMKYWAAMSPEGHITKPVCEITLPREKQHSDQHTGLKRRSRVPQTHPLPEAVFSTDLKERINWKV